jgi:hypothetical protein
MATPMFFSAGIYDSSAERDALAAIARAEQHAVA